jgi:oligopeptide/dipeptide ABC transporter ATP-binding protein
MLLDAMPRIDRPMRKGHINLKPEEKNAPILLSVDDVKVHFPIRVSGTILPKYKPLRAVDGVSFTLKQSETLGIVGESGCGKSTLARAIIKLLPKTAGTIVWCGKNLGEAQESEIRALRKEFQIVFQDPLASLDPRMTIGQSIAEPLRSLEPFTSRRDVDARVRAIMEKVGLDPAWINRYPHEFSGGQNQRVGVARAMILTPKLIVCDEAVSALDVSIQAQIIDLILALQAEFGMSLIFISHDLSVVRQVSHRVMVLYLGRIVELASRDVIYTDARHPYTKALISAVPIPDPKLERAKPKRLLPPELPSPLDTRSALMFLKSKRIDDPDAVQYQPQLIEVAPGHFVAEHDPV